MHRGDHFIFEHPSNASSWSKLNIREPIVRSNEAGINVFLAQSMAAVGVARQAMTEAKAGTRRHSLSKRQNRKPTVLAIPCSPSTTWARTRIGETMAADGTKETEGLVPPTFPPMKMDTFTFQWVTWRLSINFDEGNNLIQVIDVSEIDFGRRKESKNSGDSGVVVRICGQATSSRLSTKNRPWRDPARALECS